MLAQSEKKTHPVAVVLLVLFTALAWIPVLFTALLMLFDYTPVRGLFGSPFTGLSNLTTFLGSPYLMRLFGNSLFLWLLSLGAALLLAIPIALLCSLIRRRQSAITCAALLLLPAFIPASAIYKLLLSIFPTMIWTSASTYYLGFIAQTVLPGAALIAFVGAVSALYYRSRGRQAAVGALNGCLQAGLVYALFCLSPLYEAVWLTANPLVYAVADTFDAYVYRQSFAQMNLSIGAASFVVRSLLQAVLAVGPAILLAFWLKRQEQILPVQTLADETGRDKPGKTVFSWLIAAVLIIGLLLAGGMPVFGTAGTGRLFDNVLASLFTAILAGVIGGGLSLLFLTGARSASRPLLVVFAVLVLAFNNAQIGQYLLSRQLGLINTMPATAFHAWLQPSALLVIILFAILPGNRRSQPATHGLAAAAALFIGATAYGGIFPNLIFANTPNLRSMGVMLASALSGPDVQPGLVSLLYGLTLLPCLLLGLGAVLLARRSIRTLIET
jgi:putative aldouronate transport system permease protein